MCNVSFCIIFQHQSYFSFLYAHVELTLNDEKNWNNNNPNMSSLPRQKGRTCCDPNGQVVASFGPVPTVPLLM